MKTEIQTRPCAILLIVGSLLSAGIVDRIVAGHPDAAEEPVEFSHRMAQAIAHELTRLTRMEPQVRMAARHDRYRGL